MIKRTLLVVAIAAFVVAESSASGPFDWRRTLRRSTSSARAAKPALSRILRTPEELTKRYGPSILIREPEPTAKKSKFVRQPD